MLFSGFPQYDGFENDVFVAISRYFCQGEDFLEDADLLEELPILNSQEIAPESILAPEICHTLMKIGCLGRDKLFRALQLCLLMLPPQKRQKLHILVTFMAKLCENSKLNNLDNKLSTK